MVAAPKINPASPLNDGLLAWYLAHPAYFGGAVWPDLSGNGHDGVLDADGLADQWTATSHVGGFGSLDFAGDGANNIVLAAVPLTFSAGLTISAWVNVRSNSHDSTRVWATASSSRVLELFASSTNQRFGFTGPGGVEVVPTFAGFNYGAWYHVTVTVTGLPSMEAIPYVNGVAARSPIGVSLSDASVIGIGGTPLSRSRNEFDGPLDDVRIHNRVLSPTEIAAYYAESLGGYKTVLLSDGPVLSSPHAINHLDRSQLLSSPHLLGRFP